MSLLMRRELFNLAKQSFASCTTVQNYAWSPTVTEEFRELQIRPLKSRNIRPPKKSLKFVTPREEKMKTDQDWVSAWPAQRSFHPASVPLPVRQGLLSHGPTPPKQGNLELMKIPNFLHLTPPAITRHCAALRKFCTRWPEGLDTDDECERHFPIEITTSDYLHSAPTIRDPLSRIVILQIKLSTLPLDEHARDKFLRLVGGRYNPTTDIVTIVTDRCPLRQQNTDYAQYLLTALFFESWKYEDWEDEKVEADMEKYVWDGSRAQKAISGLSEWSRNKSANIDEVAPIPDDKLNAVQSDYKKSLVDFMAIGESEESLRRYKEATKNLLLGNIVSQPPTDVAA